MAQSKKIRVAVLYGGRSGEHEISLQSAASVIKNLDRNRYDVIPIGIDKQGRWHFNDLTLIEKQAGKELPIFKDTPQVMLPPFPSQERGKSSSELVFVGGQKSKTTDALEPLKIDVVFPVMHGPLCEDGTVQGLLELANIPYVGAGVLGSAVGMDKDVAKRLVAGAGIRVPKYVVLRKAGWAEEETKIIRSITEQIGYPVFVKPANLGSSVGIHKVKVEKDLSKAIDDAFQYDTKVLVEQGINAREIECAVLENIEDGKPPLVSVLGEIKPTHEFYSYEAKYLDKTGAEVMIPAKLSAAETKSAQEMAQRAFEALELEGMARVDLFLDRNNGVFYFNEVNTIPGFTSISLYPKMWEASGVKYKELLNKLIELALKRHKARSALKRDY